MTGEVTTEDLLAGARAALVGVPREGLGEERRSRWRGERMVRVGSAWHLGVLLLTDDAVLATSEVLRAADLGRRGYTAESSRRRAERSALAVRGGFRPGDVVHIGWSVLDIAAVDAGESSGPLMGAGGAPSVRWSKVGVPMPLEAYLRDQVALLTGPVT